jgi:ATP-binding cassette, subfamily B, bacterial
MNSLFSFVLKMVQPFKRHVVGLLCVAMGWSIVVNVQPMIIKRIIDTVSRYHGPDLFLKLAEMVALYVVIGIFFVGLFYVYDRIIMTFVPKQHQFISLHLMNQMMHHSTKFYQKNFAGNLTNKVNDVTIHTPEIIKIFMDDFSTCLFTLIFVLYNVSTVHPDFAWALLVWLSIFLGGGLFLMFRNNELAYAAAEGRARVLGHIVDIFSNMSTIRLFGRRRHEKSILKNVTHQAAEKEINRDYFFLKLHLFQGFSFWLFEALCFWWLLTGVSDGTITPGGFVLVFTLNLQILDQFWNLGKEIKEFWEKIGQLKQALRLIYSPEDLKDAANAKSLEVHRGEICFENVYFAYDPSSPLFEEKNLTIPGGQKVGLVGYSGSGKSTFVNLILRLHDVTSGRILIDHQDLRDVTQESLHQSIAVIPQDCFLFNRSLLDNIRYGRLDATFEEVKEAAMKAQMHDLIERMPHGYQTMAGEKGSRLSGGQRQRIAIARAVLKNAPILFLDEATSHLDVLTEEKLRTIFQYLMQDKTVIVVAHRLSTLIDMDRILVFDQGKIVQDGAHKDLIQEEGLYKTLWNAQTGGFILEGKS